ncbi:MULTISPECIES: energy transducer TonB [Dyella]|uniref:Energy transducer TonB n=2 Tax=Dyella TaxID=231454 RepID=A0A4R0Z0I7_9GAMM|nr:MULTISPECIES: energy transducer TonB [Dyella]TBR39785.1 energy transducer TonB [Dyella terrae]TCI12636.1 energy transducer TonB [Dyella soli]
MKKMLWAMWLASCLIVPHVHAGDSRDLESSAVIKGNIVIATDGSVKEVAIDDQVVAGTPIGHMVLQAAMQWRFEPVIRDGAAVVAKSRMSVRIVAKRKEDGNIDVRINGATFGDGTTSEELRSDKANYAKGHMPRYPESGIRSRVQGTVYLVLHVNREGKVVDIDAEQVNLKNMGPERLLAAFRKDFAESAIKAARTWTYTIPTSGPLADRNDWIVRVPVAYDLWVDGKKPEPTFWQTYMPGPRNDIPWVHAYEPQPNVHRAVDAVADTAVLTDGVGPNLLTALDAG